MTFKNTITKFSNTVTATQNAELAVCYTCPAGKTFILKELFVDIVKFATSGFINIYILKSGGIDFTTGTISSASIRARMGGEATLPDAVIQFSTDFSAVGSGQQTRSCILNSGDSIKLILHLTVAGAVGNQKASVMISGDEF